MRGCRMGSFAHLPGPALSFSECLELKQRQQERSPVAIVDGRMLESIVELYQGGLTLSEVGREVGVNRGTVWYHLRKLRLTRNVSEGIRGRRHYWGHKISESLKGRQLSEEQRQRIGRSRIVAFKEGRLTAWNKGLRKSTHPDLIRYGNRGNHHWAWKGGVSLLNSRIRQSSEDKAWRDAVFRRDDWRCRRCGVRSRSGKRVCLEADHIRPFSLSPELRFSLENGQTLCRECHVEKTRMDRAASRPNPATGRNEPFAKPKRY